VFISFATVVKDVEATNNNVEVSWNSLKAAIYEQYKKIEESWKWGEPENTFLT